MDTEQLGEYSLSLGIELKSVILIQENKYCLIYEGSTPDAKCIVKQYRGTDPSLATVEAKALLFYHELAQHNDELIDSGQPILNAEKNLLCIGFVDGTPFSDFLYQARKDKKLRPRSENFMKILGRLVRIICERTQQPGNETAPFIYEYFEYSSRRLEELPILGRCFFSGYRQDALQIIERFKKAKIVPSFIHGDLVFKNIHVRENKLGLIDFANAIYLSHPLNDIYNMRMALGNMVLPKAFKAQLLSSFAHGLGPVQFPDIAHEFYREYNRRRWLMLKLSSSIPKDFIQGLRGLATFARPVSGRIHSL